MGFPMWFSHGFFPPPLRQDALLSAVTNDVEAVDAIRRTMAAAGVAGR